MESTMRRLAVSPEQPEPDVIALAVSILQSGGIVAFPTDTVYGLAVDPRNETAVERLFAAKGRRAGIAIPIIAADKGQAFHAGTFGPREVQLGETFWPGPLSIVVPAAPVLARAIRGADDTIAVRVPAHLVARTLAGAFGFCITATSANAAGDPPAESADDLVAAALEIDCVLDAGRTTGGPPSTIVSVGELGPVLVRAGAVAFDRVIKSLR
jgi:L-threonylcarbamoyladenylate synthase